MARKRKRGPNPKVSWPDLGTPPDTWSLAEVTGVAINPLVTGIGTHPRSVSDEDWVASCEAVIEANGLAQFLTDLLHVLRITIPDYLGESPPVGDYPRRQTERDVPLPNVSYPGERGWDEDQWNEEMVGGIICNPVYAGISPFPQMVDDETWVEAGITFAEQSSVRQYLVNVLYELKKSMRAVSSE